MKRVMGEIGRMTTPTHYPDPGSRNAIQGSKGPHVEGQLRGSVHPPADQETHLHASFDGCRQDGVVEVRPKPRKSDVRGERDYNGVVAAGFGLSATVEPFFISLADSGRLTFDSSR